jgi:hypothetical protein
VAVALCGVLVFLSDKLLGGQLGGVGGDLVLLVAASLLLVLHGGRQAADRAPRRHRR